MATQGRYLYGLIRSSQDIELGDIGLPHAGAPARVYTLRAGRLAAVVSELSARHPILPLRKHLDPHHRVIREVMKTTTIIPATFGHVARSEAHIARALRRNADRIHDQHDRLDGKVEMTLKVMWNVDNVFAYFVESDAELRDARDRLYQRACAPSQPEMLELGRMFEARLAQAREQDTERISEMLSACASDMKPNPPRHEKLVMELALLVARGDLEAFEAQVYQAAAAFPAHYMFDVSGPWAPFHFVDLDLRSSALD